MFKKKYFQGCSRITSARFDEVLVSDDHYTNDNLDFKIPDNLQFIEQTCGLSDFHIFTVRSHIAPERAPYERCQKLSRHEIV